MATIRIVTLCIGAILMMPAAVGCHQITVTNVRAVDHTPSPVNEKRYSAILGDVVVIDTPVQLNAACPAGWAEINSQVTFVDGLINAIAGFFYSAHTVSVRCAAVQPTPVEEPQPSAPAVAPSPVPAAATVAEPASTPAPAPSGKPM